jgi:hypothetical protein
MTETRDTTGQTARSSSGFQVCLLVLCLAVVIRGGVLLKMPEGLRRDTDAYLKIATTLRRTGTFGFPVSAESGQEGDSKSADTRPVQATAFRPPLYPVLLSLLLTAGQLTPWAVGTLHLILGVTTVVLVWVIGRAWGLGQAAVLAAIATAGDPILVYQSTQLMTETLATLLAVLGLWGLTRWLRRPRDGNALVAGLLLGLACLCRPTFLPWCGLVTVSCCLIPVPGASRWRAPAWLLAGLIISLLPWGVRNVLQFGHLKLSTTHGGYTLLLGNNPDFYRFLREREWGAVWDSQELDQAWLRRAALRDAQDDLFALNQLPAPRGRFEPMKRNEFEDDRLAYGFARRYIREEWPMFLRSCWYRVFSLWQPLPHGIDEAESRGRSSFILRWGTAAWYSVLFGFAAMGGWRLRDRLVCAPWLWGVLLCLAFTAVHAVYWSNMRMRAPLMPFVALLAAAAMASPPNQQHANSAGRGTSVTEKPD